MKFTVSSTELLHALLSVSRAIPAKPSIPIIENFLFVLKDSRLEITATDLDLTLRTAISINLVEEDGAIAVPAKLLTDSLKEFPELPLTFTAGADGILEIKWQSGASKIPYSPATEFPALPEIEDGLSIRVDYPADILLPKDADMNKWAVVACDQFTSQPEYWEDVASRHERCFLRHES